MRKQLIAPSIAALGLAGIVVLFALSRWLPSSLRDRAGLVALAEILVLLAMTVLPVAWRWLTVGSKALVEPLAFMSASVLLYYVLRGLLLLFRDYIPGDESLFYVHATPDVLVVALGYVLAGFAAFHIGYRFWKPPLSALRRKSRWSSKTLNRLVFGAIGIACVSTAFAVSVAGGFSKVLSDFGCVRYVTVGYGYPLLGLSYWGIAFAFLFFDRLQRRSSILLPIALLLMTNVCDLFVGSRSRVIVIWITGIVLYLLSQYGKPVRTALLLCVVVLAAFGCAPQMRKLRSGCFTSPTFQEKVALVSSKAEGPQKTFLHAMSDFVALDSFSAVLAAGPKIFPLRYGGTYLDAVLFVVPHRLWPNKPKSFSFAIGQYLWHLETDYPPGFIGELYVNFRLPGTCLGMCLMGLLLRKAQQATLSGDPIAITVYAILIPYLLVFMGNTFIGVGTQILIQTGLMLPAVYFLRSSREVEGESASDASRRQPSGARDNKAIA